MGIILRPDDNPEWATTGAKDEPTPAKKANGWDYLELPPHDQFNWIQNNFAVWINFLDFLSKNISFSGSYTTGGLVVADISLEDNTSALIEVLASGLNGSNMVVVRGQWLVYRKTGTIDISNRLLYDQIGDASTGEIELAQDGNELNIKIKSTTGTWVAAGTVKINSSGIVTIN